MTHLDLFSGIGGFALAARWAGIETVQFVEYEPYAQKVLAKNFPKIPIAGDIFEFDATKFLGVGLVTGGFPCQPFSQAGKRLGNKDDRAIWPQMLRVIREARPTWVLGENVSGIITMELDNVLSDLEREGYTTQTLIIPATGVDAKHRRERVWIVAHSNSGLSNRKREGICTGRNSPDNGSKDVANSECKRLEGFRGECELGESGEKRQVGRSDNVPDPTNNGCKFYQHKTNSINESEKKQTSDAEQHSSRRKWLPEPDVGRVANGVPSRVDRIKGLGNAIVPQVAFEIMRHMKI